MTTRHFHFAIPQNATRYSVDDALSHIAKTYKVSGDARFIREEPAFRLYCIDYKVAA